MRAATVMVTRSMDELGDQDMGPAERVHHSSLPIMQSKNVLSQGEGSAMMQCIRAAAKKDGNDDVHMHGSDTDAYSPTSGDAITIEPPVSTRPQSWTNTNNRPLCSTTTTTTTTKHSRKKRLEPPSPTPVRPAPTPIALRAPVGSQPPAANRPSAIRASTSPPKPPSQGLTLALPASQGHGSKRALGMRRNVPRAASVNNTPHSAAIKKPFRPPLARASQPVGAGATAAPSPAAASPRDSKPTRKRQADEGMSAAADPDSSFDISFDFDPDALEAAMKKYD